MLLRGIYYRPVFNASGARGPFGEGYKADRLWGPLRARFGNCGFNAKTTTLLANAGNMPMRPDGITPQEIFPRCIYVDIFKEIMLNAVGLSGPGLEFLLNDGRWQARMEPFFISFSPIGKTRDERLDETQVFVDLLQPLLPSFRSRVGLEIDISCPNVGHDPNEWIYEVLHLLDITLVLNMPQQCKFNAVASPELVSEVCSHPACDAVVVSNTIPWLMLPEWIDWHKLFGMSVSPLARRGFSDGGLSGWPLLPIVCNWIREIRKRGFKKPIWACGGIDSVRAVDKVHVAGASGIQVGCVKSLRPWRVPGIIRRAHELFE
ncbi:MAG: hypothetical protein Q7S57_06280 [bacterium]|nr:hypothetical protein [bacterium]